MGTYTYGDSEGVYGLSFDMETGETGALELLVETQNPSYLTLLDEGAQILLVNEDVDGTVSLFNRSDNGYKFSAEVETEGSAPCYVAINENGLYSVANYSSGNVRFGSIGQNGFTSYKQVMYHRGTLGSNSERQESPHAHYASFSGNNAYAVDLGIDEVLFYENSERGFDQPQTALKLQKGDGPRHLEFHPNGKYVYVLNELSNTVVASQVDPQTGFFASFDRKSTLPEGFEGESYAADIHIDPSGKFLYCSNRGHESLAIFKIGEDGSLESLGHQSVMGKWPRNFTISPNGKWLLVANERSSNIVVFKIDEGSGRLKQLSEIKAPNPTCLKFGR